MNVFHSEGDSLAWWRSDAPYFGREVCASPCPLTELSEYARSLRDVNDSRSSRFRSGDMTGLLVPTSCTTRKSSHLTFHKVGFELPASSLYEIGKSEFVCSPELIFFLMASKRSFHELVCLGMELCGCYSCRSDDGIVEHDPITTKADILAFLNEVAGQRFARKARHAAEHLCDGSRSPRETDLYMMLCLPSKLGGFGLSGAELNRTLTVSPRAASQTGMESITPDLSWIKAKVAAEYESSEWHSPSLWDVSELSRTMHIRNQIAVDSARRRTYEAMGFFVITVTNDEFNSFDEVTRIATTISRHLGKHGLRKDSRLMWRRQELHEWLKVPLGSRGKAPTI